MKCEWLAFYPIRHLEDNEADVRFRIGIDFRRTLQLKTQKIVVWEIEIHWWFWTYDQTIRIWPGNINLRKFFERLARVSIVVSIAAWLGIVLALATR